MASHPTDTKGRAPARRTESLPNKSEYLGQVVACEVVWAETVSVFPDGPAAAAALREAGVEFNACGEECALIAGMVFASYRARGGKRDRVVADFLVGAHAMVRADRLLTRDRGFYRSYFVGLEILGPTARKSSR